MSDLTTYRIVQQNAEPSEPCERIEHSLDRWVVPDGRLQAIHDAWADVSKADRRRFRRWWPVLLGALEGTDNE